MTGRFLVSCNTLRFVYCRYTVSCHTYMMYCELYLIIFIRDMTQIIVVCNYECINVYIYFCLQALINIIKSILFQLFETLVFGLL